MPKNAKAYAKSMDKTADLHAGGQVINFTSGKKDDRVADEIKRQAAEEEESDSSY